MARREMVWTGANDRGYSWRGSFCRRFNAPERHVEGMSSEYNSRPCAMANIK